MFLEEFHEPLDMTQTELAERIGVPINRVNEIIKQVAPAVRTSREQLRELPPDNR